jgi:hypothetical protein
MIGVMIPPVASSSLGIAGLMRMPMLTMHTEVTQSPSGAIRNAELRAVASVLWRVRANPLGSGSGASLDLNLAFRD